MLTGRPAISLWSDIAGPPIGRWRHLPADRALALERLASIASVALLLGLQLTNRTLPQYVDESDNLLGGQLIAHGYRLYVDYFSQHMPLPYIFAALATTLGARDLTTYRVSFALLTALVFALVSLYLGRSVPRMVMVFLAVLVGLGHPIYSGEMVLADQFFGLSLLVLVLLMLAWDGRHRPSPVGQLVISACCFCAVESTLISIYPLSALGAYYVVRRMLAARRAARADLRLAAIVAAPHLVLAAVLLQSGGLDSFVDQAIVFNQRYYSHYEMAGDPVGVLGAGLADFLWTSWTYLRLSGVREMETVFLVSNLAAAVLLWRARGRGLATSFLSAVILSRLRGAGYHGAPYFLLSFVSMSLLLSTAIEAAVKMWSTWPAVQSWTYVRCTRRILLFAAMGLYVAFAGLFVHDLVGFDRRLPRGQGFESAYATAVLAMTGPEDRLWAAPNDPYLYLVTGRLPASRYTYYQPWLSDAPTIQAAIVDDLRATQPPVVVFQADKHIDWKFPLPVPAEYGGNVYAYIRRAYIQVDGNDPVLKDVYRRAGLAP